MDLKNLIINFLLLVSINIIAMEQSKNFRKMLIGQPSLKFLCALEVANAQVPMAKELVPEEVIEFVNKIKNIQLCQDCAEEEKKFFLNLLNDPEINIERYFCNLLKKYDIYNENFKNKYQLLDNMLSYTSYNNEIMLVQLLLNFGASVNVQDLNLAIHLHNKEIVRILLDFVTDINEQDANGYTALIWAVLFSDKEIIEKLIAKGANVNIKSDNNRTALIVASKGNSNEAIIQILKKAGAKE